MSQLIPVHKAIRSLLWLEGTWVTEFVALGKYPTIKSFKYCEQVIFESIGQPMYNYSAQSWHPESKNRMHREVGILKVLPDTNKAALFVTHNFGVSTIEEGEYVGTELNLESTIITRKNEYSKAPHVTQVKRQFKLIGDRLQHTLCMATEKTPELHQHLQALYKKKK